MIDLFWFFAVVTVFIGALVAAGMCVDWVDRKNPFFEAEKFRKANERFKEICEGKK